MADDTSNGAAESTPLFDVTLQTLPPAPSTATDRVDEPPWPTDDPDEVDQWYGGDPPEPAIDPETREGRAILRLFRMLKECEVADSYPPGRWDPCATVETVCEWLRSLGIDPDESPVDAVPRLTLAARARPGQSLRASDYTMRISTEHRHARAVLASVAHVLAEQLGPGTAVTVLDADERVLVRHEHAALTAKP